MDIRKIKSDELNQMIPLRDYCFSRKYNQAKLDDYIYWTKASDSIGLFDGDILGGQLMILPLEMMLNKRRYEFGGIGFVGLYPEYRSGGFMKKMIQQALVTMRENNQLLSILGPFSIPYYRKMGWELMYDVVSYEIPMNEFPSFEGVEKVKFKRYDFTTFNESGITDLHNQVVSLNQGWMYRDQAWWNRLKAREPDSLFVVFEGGYLRYNKEGTTFVINDFVFATKEVEQQLYNFIALHRSNFYVVKGVTSVESNMNYYLSEKKGTRQLGNNFMARIVDVEKYLQTLDIQVLEPFILNVTDELCDWNERPMLFDQTGVHLTDELDNENGYEWVSMDISSLSASLLGYFGVNRLESLGLISGTELGKERFGQLVPKNEAVMFDHF